jgi:hypothetical protein
MLGGVSSLVSIARISTRHPLASRLPFVPMRHFSTGLFLVAAAINLAPAAGAVLPERMAALYGLAIDDPNLEILMRHRAVLFGIVGSLLVAAAFHRPLRAVGYVAGFTSMLSFLLIAWLVGGYSEQIQRVVIVDLAGIAALAGAGIAQLFGPRSTNS